MPRQKIAGIRTRPPGSWKQWGELFEIAGIGHRKSVAEGFVRNVTSSTYTESLLPLVARREPDNRHDPNAIAIDAQWTRRRWFRGPTWKRHQLGYVPADIAKAFAADFTSETGIAVDFYDASIAEQGQIYIRCLLLVPGTRKS